MFFKLLHQLYYKIGKNYMLYIYIFIYINIYIFIQFSGHFRYF